MMRWYIIGIYVGLLGIFTFFAVPIFYTNDTKNISKISIENIHWYIEDKSFVPSIPKEPLLLLDLNIDSKPQAASTVLLLIHAPYNKVQPALQQAIEEQKNFTQQSKEYPIAYGPDIVMSNIADIDDNWSKVLLSNRPDLRDKLVEQFKKPALIQAVQKGAILPKEMKSCLDQERLKIDSLPQDRIKLKEFNHQYPFWIAIKQESNNLHKQNRDNKINKIGSTLVFTAFDASEFLKQTATIIQIRRIDRYVTPYGMQDISVVPGSALQLTNNVLTTIHQTAHLAINSKVWIKPIEKPITARPLSLAAPDTNAPLIKPLIYQWDWHIVKPNLSDIEIEPERILTLPNGDILFLAGSWYNDTSHKHVYRISKADNYQTIYEIWKGRGNIDSTDKISINSEGTTIWWNSETKKFAKNQLISFDLKTNKISNYMIKWSENDSGNFDYAYWMIMGDQVPIFFNRVYHYIADSKKESEKNLVGNDYFTVTKPVMSELNKQDELPFKLAISSLRQSFMSYHNYQGNTQIQPISFRSKKEIWVQDPIGVAALDAINGRVLRAFAMPQRNEEPNPYDSSGITFHVPESLGSPESNWVATGYRLFFKDDTYLPPSLKNKNNIQTFTSRNHFVGMHVMNINNGNVFSPLLGCADSLQVLARSANGRFLAMGSRDICYKHEDKIVLWDLEKKITPIRLDTSQITGNDEDLYSLAFSWDGADLWCLVRGGKMYHWHLPDNIQDKANKGAFPDQSGY